MSEQSRRAARPPLRWTGVLFAFAANLLLVTVTNGLVQVLQWPIEAETLATLAAPVLAGVLTAFYVRQRGGMHAFLGGLLSIAPLGLFIFDNFTNPWQLAIYASGFCTLGGAVTELLLRRRGGLGWGRPTRFALAVGGSCSFRMGDKICCRRAENQWDLKEKLKSNAERQLVELYRLRRTKDQTGKDRPAVAAPGLCLCPAISLCRRHDAPYDHPGLPAGALPPLIFRQLIDVTFPSGDMRQLNILAVALFVVPLLDALLGTVQRHFSARAGEGVIYDLRREMYAHLQRMSLRFFTNTKAGDIISRFNNDVVGAQGAITGTIPQIVTNIVTLVSTLAVMLTIEWRLTLLAVGVLPLFILPARRVGRILRGIRRQALDYNADMGNQVGETLTVNGALLVKTFGREEDEMTRYERSAANVRDIGIRRAKVGQFFFAGLGLVGALGTAIVYGVGGHLVLSGAMTTGTIVAFVAYLGRLYGPLTSLSNVQVEFVTALVSFERVFEYLDLPIEIQERPDAVALGRVEGRIEFDHAYFQYEDASAGCGRERSFASRRRRRRRRDNC